MWKIAIAVALGMGVADADDKRVTPTLVGTWRVTGCETSPRDPANCAQGKIVFTAKRWSVELSCCKRASDYVVVSTAPDQIKISSEGTESVVTLDADGHAHWNPGMGGGRFRSLSFVRAK